MFKKFKVISVDNQLSLHRKALEYGVTPDTFDFEDIHILQTSLTKYSKRTRYVVVFEIRTFIFFTRRHKIYLRAANAQSAIKRVEKIVKGGEFDS